MRQYCQRLNVNFGRMDRKDRFQEIAKLADILMTAIKAVIPVLPISLVSAVFINSDKQGLSAYDVESRTNRIMKEMQSHGAPLQVASRNRVESILKALNMLRLRKLVSESDSLYKPVAGDIDVLTYYANSIVHWLSDGHKPM